MALINALRRMISKMCVIKHTTYRIYRLPHIHVYWNLCSNNNVKKRNKAILYHFAETAFYRHTHTHIYIYVAIFRKKAHCLCRFRWIHYHILSECIFLKFFNITKYFLRFKQNVWIYIYILKYTYCIWMTSNTYRRVQTP